MVDSPDPYRVRVCDDADDPARSPEALAHAAAVLIDAGYLTERDRFDDMTLRVWPPAGQIPVVALARSAGRHCRECAEAMTAVEYAASVAYGWSGRCADCQAEHLAQATTDDQRV